jgi:hypothetical protein
VRRRLEKVTAGVLTEKLIPHTSSHPLDDYLDWNA